LKLFCSGLDGYIGNNLKKILEEAGHNYVNFDLTKKLDVRDIEAVRHYMSECDGVIHLAAVLAGGYCDNHIMEAIETNTLGTSNVAQVAGELNLPMVFTSTFAAKTLVNTYGLTKRLGEYFVLKNNGTALRLSNVYGGKEYFERKTSVISNFVNAKNRNEAATIFGDGSQVRDFMHVTDACQAIINGLSTSSGIYEVYAGMEANILELAEMIGVKYMFKPIQEGDVAKVEHDPHKLIPNWKAVVTLEEGLKQFVREGS